MKKFIFMLILLITSVSTAGWSKVIVKSGGTVLKKYQTLYIDVQLDTSFHNPFDTEEVYLSLDLYSSLDNILHIPGFYNGDSLWQIRFTPTEVGTYQGKINFQTRKETSIVDSIAFVVEDSIDADGFIRMNPDNNFSFKFESGKIFRGIGENVGWADDYEYYFRKLSETGCNIMRIWMCPWNLSFEWSETGLGRYNLKSAARLDSILDLASQYSIYIMLCFDYHGVIQKGTGHFNENTWSDNPYNEKNGGPCKYSWEFFTDSLAKKNYKNRLLYLVSRYGFSTYIHSWEFWNEVDLTSGVPADVISWHCEMADYLHSIDPYNHLITTSFAVPRYPDLWKCPGLDFSQHHIYYARNMPHTIDLSIKKTTTEYDKPHVIGEFGVEFRGVEETKRVDPENIGFHNALWAGLVAETPIIPLTWWWDNLVDPDSLYFHIGAISKLWNLTVKDTSKIEAMEIFVYHKNAQIDSANTILLKDLTIFPIKNWGKNIVSQFEIDKNDGKIENYTQIPYQIYGTLNPEWRNPPEFIITYKDSGKFSVHIDRISHHGKLNIFVDDSLALEKPLPMEPGKGEHQEIIWVEEIQRYQGRYNKTYSIDIPPGRHTIRVENDSLDYFEVSYYKFENCGIIEKPKVEARGIKVDDDALIWIRNNLYTWKRVSLAGLNLPISNVKLILPDIGKGKFYLEWWDTYKAKLIAKENVKVSGNAALAITVPPVQKDFACRIIQIPPISFWEKALTVCFGIIVLMILFWILKGKNILLKQKG